MGKAPDMGWAYATLVEGTRNHVKCNYCNFVSTGGITRQKHHLAGTSPNVQSCSKVTPDVKKIVKEHLERKKHILEEMHSIPHFDDVVDLEDEDDVEVVPNSKGKRPMSTAKTNDKKLKGTLDGMFKPSTTTGKKGGHLVGSVEHTAAQKKLSLEAVQRFCRWMYDAGIAFNAVNYDSLGPALEAVARYGCGMKPPSYHEVRVSMLKLELDHTKQIMHENEVEKSTYGCSLMADGWRDRKGRALINFLVNTPRGSMFIESVDASSYSHTGENMFKLFDRFITQVGAGDVVQIVTDSASNNVAAGKEVEKKYPHIYWTPCAAHCIDLMFEDIFKLPHLKKALEKAIAVNTYIYNRTLLLNLMREKTGQRDMVRPAKTRFATAFITLECFKTNKKQLRKMFTCEAWTTSKFAKEVGGVHTARTIALPTFWNGVDVAVKIGKPLLKVLRLVDGEKKPPMGYIYEAMDMAKEQIAKKFNGKEEKYKDIFEIIDRRWNCQLHRPLHAAGHYLNPVLYYNNPGVDNDDEVTSGLHACIHKLALTEEEEFKIHSELPLYRSAEGNLGTPVAKKMRAVLAPAVWWQQYGSTTLKQFAVKVLSLTCSSSGCERNWSVFEHLHSKKRSRLNQQKLNDLVYIKYNRALRRRYNMRDSIDPIILDEENVQDPHEWLLSALENEEDAPVHEGEDLTWGQVAEASGAGEPIYSTRASVSGSQRGRGGTSSSRPTGPTRGLVDEDDFDAGVEENDVAAYKHYEATSDFEEDEPEYEDLSD